MRASEHKASRLAELYRENGVLARELACVQARCTAVAQQQSQRIEELQAALIRQRAALIARDTEVWALRERVRRLDGELSS